MNIRPILSSILATILPFALTSCGGESDAQETPPADAHGHDHSHDGHDHSHDGHGHSHSHADSTVWLSWPGTDFEVFEDVDFVFGSAEEGRLALLVGRDPVPAGQKVTSGSDVHLLDAGAERHVLKLPEGEQKVTLQLCSADGTSKGPEHATTATFQVKKTPPDLGVWFEEPEDGAQVRSPVKLRFGVGGMVLEPAGIESSIPLKTRGHHHVIVDGQPLPVGVVVPADEKNIHYGQAQTEAELELPPGKHTLTMQFADALHQSYGPRLAKTITIEVVE